MQPCRPVENEPIRQVIYVSSAREKLSPDQVVSLLDVSRRNNARDGITGMLLYRGGNFIQVIEGPAASVEDLLDRLRRNPAHHGIIILADREVEGRDFEDWTMGFRDISGLSPEELPGGNRFWDDPGSASISAGRALKLLLSFRRHIT